MGNQTDIAQQIPLQPSMQPQAGNNFPWAKVLLLIIIIAIPTGVIGYILGTKHTTSSPRATVYPFMISPTQLPTQLQFSHDNNTQRRSDVGQFLNAFYQYAADNKGVFPPSMPAPGSNKKISTTETGHDFCTALVPTYLAALPRDPSVGSFLDCNSYNTGYLVTVRTVGSGNAPRITVSAPNAELGVVISITR